MTFTITPEDILAYHKATGCPLEDARHELDAMDPDLRERVVIASRTHSGEDHLLTDPIEQDPVVGPKVRQAEKEAERRVKYDGIGRCHAVWHEQARILWDKYRIRWYSPAQMNPQVLMD
jgi:hypothetical protein